MRKISLIKIFILSLAIAAICANGGFSFATPQADASKVTKWQIKLQQLGIDPALWQKCLPKVTRAEYVRVLKLAANSGSVAQAPVVSSLGPEISVGLWYNSKDDPFYIEANKAYNIKDGNGTVVAAIASGDTTTKVGYDDDQNKLEISNPVPAPILVDDKITFDAADGDNTTLIFNVHASDSYDHYRGKIEINYYHGADIYNGNSGTVTQLWVVNVLPLCHAIGKI